ncbi:hypothetical protein [Tahibacter amnicola]|uniref:NnrS protein n=1 Tax=Tahibacter amnicola TaxID=2976241 RepID=A0ABY6BCF9_9GAMM|nr:hypothetical protein [Tahibacter amnicola]UXI67261.1 hypothetical protein N4264_21350 [Tahibacter amnicola]
MTTARYVLPDEPSPGPMAKLAVNPIWPLLACMLVGTWLGVLWFAFNSFAMGSPTWRRELAMLALAFLGGTVLVFGLVYAFSVGWLDKQSLRYAWLSVTALRLCCFYVVHLAQSRTFELFTYFGGKPAQGAVVLILGVLSRSAVSEFLGMGILAVILL